MLRLGLLEGWGIGGWADDLAATGADRFLLRTETGDEVLECGHMLERSDEMG
jgi:hypothetical protein